jgi:hypothetical protein
MDFLGLFILLDKLSDIKILDAGHNPDNMKFTSLRPENGQTVYEQPNPADTRYLLCAYGAQPGSPDYINTQSRLNLAPNSEIVFYVAVMANDNLELLKQTSQSAETLIDGNINIQVDPNSPTLPLLQVAHMTAPNTVTMNWTSYTNPDHFEMMYKLSDAPATAWQSVSLPGTARTGTISTLTNGMEYKFKVAAIFMVDGNEVYLETEPRYIFIDNSNPVDDPVVAPGAVMSLYPNPFAHNVKIKVQTKLHSSNHVTVYNLKGQKITELTNPEKSETTSVYSWDGKNSLGRELANGVYFVKLQTADKTYTQKLLLLR